MLTAESYVAIGGVTGALATHADEIVRNASGQQLIQRIFRALVTPERTRAIVELAELHQLATDRDEVTRTIDLLVRARLLVAQMREGGGGSVEIVHESLIERWPMLRRWLDEGEGDAAFAAGITAAARQWDAKGRPQGLLWRGDAMEEARRWYAARPRELAVRERAFLDAVFSLARRGRVIRRVALASTFAVLAAFGVVASIGYVQVRDAKAHEAARAVEAAAAAKRATEAYDNLVAEQKKREQAEEDAKKSASAQLAAETAEREKAADLAMSREELIEKNKQLAQLLADTQAAEQRAVAATRAEKDAQAALKAKLDEELAKNKKLQEELKKVATSLKD
jgi:hypothetical protein